MSYYPVLFVVPFLVLLPIYLHARKKGAFRKATVLKLTLSGLCTLCALLGFAFWGIHNNALGVLIVIALLCAIFGDYFLQFMRLDERKSTVGILCFALTHVLLIVFLCLRHGVSWPEFVLTAVIMACVQVIMIRQKWELGRTKTLLVLYTSILGFMTSKAVLALFASPVITLPVALMAVGAVLLVFSDLLLGKNSFAPVGKSPSGVHLIIYFCGLLLIALSSWY
ncbi:MAG: lysoplasmalogenase [Coriobacteriia bacterium]|nr:lysoplasmalogenase [Coriobacteriia bacterium]